MTFYTISHLSQQPIQAYSTLLGYHSKLRYLMIQLLKVILVYLTIEIR